MHSRPRSFEPHPLARTLATAAAVAGLLPVDARSCPLVVELEDEVRDAARVARIRITRSEPATVELHDRTHTCGRRFRAEVVEGFKGGDAAFWFVSDDAEALADAADEFLVVADAPRAPDLAAAFALETIEGSADSWKIDQLCRALAADYDADLAPFDRCAGAKLGGSWIAGSGGISPSGDLARRRVSGCGSIGYGLVAWSDVRDRILAVLRGAPDRTAIDPDVAFDSLSEAGERAFAAGDDDAAERYWLAALSAAEAPAPDDARVVKALQRLSAAAARQNRWDDARGRGEHRVAILRAERNGDRRQLADALVELANLYWVLGLDRHAEASLTESLDVRSELDPSGLDRAAGYLELASLHWIDEEYGSMLDQLERMVAVFADARTPMSDVERSYLDSLLSDLPELDSRLAARAERLRAAAEIVAPLVATSER